MEATVIARRFGQAEMHIVQDEHGEGWVPGEEIGKALEYPNPRRSINNLFRRHRDILGAPQYSGDTKVMTPGGSQVTRCYSEQGVYLLLMYSRQPQAREFQKWVAKVLAGMRKEYLAALEGKIEQMEKALDPDRKKLLDDCWGWECQAYSAGKKAERMEEKIQILEKRSEIYWKALSTYPNQRELEWAHVERVRDNGLLPMKQVWWSPGGRVMKMSFHVIRQEV